MAISSNDYKTTKEKNIKVHKKDKRLFLFDFRINNRRYRKKYHIKATNHTPLQMLKTARTQLDIIKDEIINGTYSNNLIKLDKLFIDYMETQPLTDWTHKKKHIYDLYIGDSQLSNITKEPTEAIMKKRQSFNITKIGNRAIGDIKERDILMIISKMEKEHNLSPRTQKIILEVLNPVFDYAIRNRYLTENPAQHITIKIPSQKKIVTNATELFKRVYMGIIEYYHDEPFYKALFLFAFTGRRKSEILNLKWENIDFTNNYYWIEDTKNGEKQRFKLSPMLGAVIKFINTDNAKKEIAKHSEIVDERKNLKIADILDSSLVHGGFSKKQQKKILRNSTLRTKSNCSVQT